MEEIDRCIFNGAKTKRDGLQWVIQSYELTFDADGIDHLLYLFNIIVNVSTKYKEKLKDLIGDF